MKIGILTDIHGDFETLERVWRRLSELEVDRFICLGDLVVHGDKPNEVVEHFRALPHVPVLMGNHDIGATIDDARLDGLRFFSSSSRENTLACRSALSPENRAYLAGLPAFHREGSVLYTHATIEPPSSEARERLWELYGLGHGHGEAEPAFLSNPFGLLRHEPAVRSAFEAMPPGVEVMIAGHTHRTRIHHWPADKAVWGTDYPVESGSWKEPLTLRAGDRYIINVGCTAQLKYDFFPPVCAVFEPEARRLAFHQLDDLRPPRAIDWTGK